MHALCINGRHCQLDTQELVKNLYCEIETNCMFYLQIDGFFASMGHDGELSEDSVRSFLTKGLCTQKLDVNY